ncbi:MAG TPA: dihydroxy-acid dehydratase, partial [Dehalococcoidia bacterium]
MITQTDLRGPSHTLVDGPDRAPARAMLYATGLTDEDLSKPLIGVANTWIEIGPCNFHLRRLSARVKDGIRAAGGTPLEFNTIAVSDGISMGTEGMKASLISREVIADSIELVTRGHLLDGVVAVGACDKTEPGLIMALARLNLPSLYLYGGSIYPGVFEGRAVDILDVFEAVGSYAAGKMTAEQLRELEHVACPGPGACGGQYTANTMAMAIEMLGMSLIDSASVPAMDPKKDDVAFEVGQQAVQLLRQNLRPRDVITKASLENAIRSVLTSGGSTNAVLHLLAIAREAGVELSIDDFDRISRTTPIIADMKPGGRYVANDLYEAGGVRLVANRMLEAGMLHPGPMTVSGRTIGEEVRTADERPGQPVVSTADKPFKATGGLVILKGNLAPEGCVLKVAGHERMEHRGPARVFDREEDAFAAV